MHEAIAQAFVNPLWAVLIQQRTEVNAYIKVRLWEHSLPTTMLHQYLEPCSLSAEGCQITMSLLVRRRCIRYQPIGLFVPVCSEAWAMPGSSSL
jgi:hypothetical protein